jgi:hypothetical protein
LFATLIGVAVYTERISVQRTPCTARASQIGWVHDFIDFIMISYLV